MKSSKPNPVSPGGGSVAIRGFLVQTLAALLEVARFDCAFTEITLEPAVGDDQFDFIWKDKNGSYATQVKSTLNSFSRADVEKWAKKLKMARVEETCTLVLVGNIPPRLTGIEAIDGVLIETKHLHLGDLVEQAAQRVAKFLESEGLPAGTALQRETVVHALTSHLEHLATKSAPLSRESFLGLLRQWVNSAPKGYARVDFSCFKVQKYAPAELFGRTDQIDVLDQAWSRVSREQKPRLHILTFVAFGGEGKTSLVAKWAAKLAEQDWPGCDAAFAWSFYSQGTRQQSVASSDMFLKEALTFFASGSEEEVKEIKAFAAGNAGAFEKGQRLARIVGQRRSLLILDGLEPLQHAPTSPTPGELRDQGIAALLRGLATTSHGLCIVTTRYSLQDLRAFWRTTAPEVKLLRLSRDAGVSLLKSLGTTGTAKELETLVEDVKGHALTLNLLGGFLKRAFHGDIRQRERVKFEKADAKMDGGHAFRTLAAYEQWLLRDGGDEGLREMVVLRLMGLFDRPADAGCLGALRREPIPGLTEPLAGLADDDWEFCISGLEAAKLLIVNREASGTLVSLDAHPHLREYFAKQLREHNPAAWRSANRRLYEHLCATTEDKPQPTLDDLQPLYQAVAHGCHMGAFEDALRVYKLRVKRQRQNLSTARLGAFSSNLAALACFFDVPWSKPNKELTDRSRAEVADWSGFRLSACGRLEEARNTLKIAMPFYEALGDWRNAANVARNLSETCITLGELAEAAQLAERGIDFAKRGDGKFILAAVASRLADAFHQMGHESTSDQFINAEHFWQDSPEGQSAFSFSLHGFHYCDFLLDRNDFSKVIRLAEDRLSLTEDTPPLLSRALAFLARGRAKAAQAINERPQSPVSSALDDLNKAIQWIRRANRQDYLPKALLARSWVLSVHNQLELARVDLDEAWEIAQRGPMRLHLADIQLHRVRLFFREEKYPWESAKNDLDSAEKLIKDCGYHRRDRELDDAKRAIPGN